MSRARSESPNRARRRAAELLEDAIRSGVTHIDRLPAPPGQSVEEPPAALPSEPIEEGAGEDRKAANYALASESPPPTDPAAAMSSTNAAAARSADERRAELKVIARDVAACTRCDVLARTRTQTVFGVGTVTPRLCFLGEAPGADEDAQGEPFVGRAGQLLTRIIEACTLRREDVYILNILKCRPPDNRNPLPDEAANCRGFLDRQLDILRPEFICCLGSVAAQNLLASEESIGRMRGRFFNYRGAQVLCTYHPAYLLRNPSAKRQVWEDMQLLMQKMGIDLPASKDEPPR